MLSGHRERMETSNECRVCDDNRCVDGMCGVLIVSSIQRGGTGEFTGYYCITIAVYE